ncbi:MAG: RidA family protein [Steroidobacteraceae bacterium]
MLTRLLVLAGLSAALPAIAADAGHKYIVNERPGITTPLPFSEGVVAGNTLYIAGTLGLDAATGQAPADVKAEAQLLMDAVKKTVGKAGFTMNDVVSVTVFCTDLKLYDTFNAVYRSYFGTQYPARAFIGAATLLRGAHFEVQGIAVH